MFAVSALTSPAAALAQSSTRVWRVGVLRHGVAASRTVADATWTSEPHVVCAELARSRMGAATYVDKMLRGAVPAEASAEQPTTVELAMISKPPRPSAQSLLLGSDQVIE